MLRRDTRYFAILLLAGLMVPTGLPRQLQADDNPAPPPIITPATPPTSPQPNPPAPSERDKALASLEEIKSEVERVAPGQSLQDESLAVVAVVEQSHIGSTNYYTADGVKYFATRVTLVNRTDETLTIPKSSFELTADQQTFTLEQSAKSIRQMPLQVGNRTEPANRLQPQTDVEVPGGEQVSTWLMFAGLEKGPHVPQLTLRFDAKGKTQTVDLTLFHRGLLKLDVQKIGPRGALGLITIGGLLDSVSAAHLTDALDQLAIDGVARCVIRWSDDASPVTSLIMNWLVTSRIDQRRQNRRNSELPRITESIRDMRLATVPRQSHVTHYSDASAIPVYSDDADAVGDALRSAFEVLPPEDILREIEQGHRLSRAAALQFGGRQLRPRDVETVLDCTDDEDELIRTAAIDALQHFADDAAVARLVDLVRQGEETTSERALSSLAASRFPAAHNAVVALLERGIPMSRKSLILVLARRPRPQWTEEFVDAASDDDPEVRLAALRALERIGHPRRPELLSEALKSDHEPLRKEAFRQLVQLADPDREALAVNYALERLKTEPPDGYMTTLLTRTRDARAAPLLIEHLKQKKPSNPQNIVRLLAQIGGPDVDAELAEHYPKVSEHVQATILEVLSQLHSPLVRNLAADALLSKQSSLVNSAANAMLTDGSDDAVKVLATALAATDRNNNWSYICNALSNIGTPAARAVLRQARKTSDENLQRIVVQALRNLSARSTGGQLMRQAQASMRQDKWKDAEEQYSVALELDPDLLEAWQGRGNARLKLERFKEAAEDFQQVLEIDPDDGEAITGLGVALAVQGDHEKAVKLVTEKADKFEKDVIFAYNTACVYGRAAESLAKTAESDERDEQIEAYREAAIAALEKSIELGFADEKLMKSDPDLNSLRDTDGFKTLMHRLNGPAAEEPAPEPETDGESDTF
ncbi:Tetratricopeptide repeat protein [Maioricimonas rarisocia]|uniref:Tetratricopeptide repeat protein n=1 Tax=Maioricimonas rarisocia TaxID=2528026 RepID=A0A517ZDL6_9PLAN|nr:HEAT repeat domain-containing protein [Maioricimonas rarisocia]QDU40558.1 Tetratricopeptide repeat protein [Maioricimonas rarisocia]